MRYVDTSVVLAELLAEDARPSDDLWQQTLVSSRLLEYEVWTRVHARELGRSHGEGARALEAFPAPVGTLDALHLASLEFLRERQPAIRLATYDGRQATVAEAMGIALYDLEGDVR